MTVRPNCGVSRLYDLILHGALKLAINQHSCSLSRHSCHSHRCHNKKMQEQIFTINKVDTASLRSSFKTGFFHNSPQILSLTASPCKDVRRMKWFQFKNTHVTPLDQWEFFVQNLDEGIKKNRRRQQALVSCVSRQFLFQFCAQPNHSFLKFGHSDPRVCFAGYSGIGNSSCQFVVYLQALLQLIQSLLAGIYFSFYFKHVLLYFF